MITTLAVHGYRSLRELVLPMRPVTVVTGENGAGKSSLYRALRLLAATASTGVITPLARDGGLQRVLWAGPEHVSRSMRSGDAPVQGAHKRTAPVSLMLGIAGCGEDGDLGYLIDIGLPPRGNPTVFEHDPQIKREELFSGPVLRRGTAIASRKNTRVSVEVDAGREIVMDDLSARESMLSELLSPDLSPELLLMRRRLRSWRFYDSFRTDVEAPSRRASLTTWTPVLADDGHDLAAAVATIGESAWSDPFDEAVERAFPGTRVDVASKGDQLELAVRQPGMLRALTGAELSDGTLRFVLLCTALLSPQPPGLLVLNEPETSLHPEVLPVLAGLIAEVARRTQVLVVSHSAALIEPLTAAGAGIGADNEADDAGEHVVHHHLVKSLGETVVEGQGMLSRPRWEWGTR